MFNSLQPVYITDTLLSFIQNYENFNHARKKKQDWILNFY